MHRYDSGECDTNEWELKIMLWKYLTEERPDKSYSAIGNLMERDEVLYDWR